MTTRIELPEDGPRSAAKRVTVNDDHIEISYVDRGATDVVRVSIKQWEHLLRNLGVRETKRFTVFPNAN
ncbi:MAG: hypothetical protein V3S01_08170 [Dehalococcoidia bacterium]